MRASPGCAGVIPWRLRERPPASRTLRRPLGGADGGLDVGTEGRIEEMRCSCPSAGGICGPFLLATVVAMSPLSVVLTLWRSRIAALEVGSQSRCTRSRSRSTARICSQRPSIRQLRQ